MHIENSLVLNPLAFVLRFLGSYLQINAASEVIFESVDPNANIIFGALVDTKMGDKVKITVLATGFEATSSKTPQPQGKFKKEPPSKDPDSFSSPRKSPPREPPAPPASKDESFLSSFRRL